MDTLTENRELSKLLKRGVAEIISEKEMVELLHSGRKLRIKEGFDPSAPDIHLGHMVSLRKLRQFQDAGHRVVLIVADWTAQIGDPSGVTDTRPILSREQVLKNAETYLKQFFKIVDEEKTKYNGRVTGSANLRSRKLSISPENLPLHRFW
jgi:tyrosyl-tRNA synthetase